MLRKISLFTIILLLNSLLLQASDQTSKNAVQNIIQEYESKYSYTLSHSQLNLITTLAMRLHGIDTAQLIHTFFIIEIYQVSDDLLDRENLLGLEIWALEKARDDFRQMSLYLNQKVENTPLEQRSRLIEDLMTKIPFGLDDKSGLREELESFLVMSINKQKNISISGESLIQTLMNEYIQSKIEYAELIKKWRKLQARNEGHKNMGGSVGDNRVSFPAFPRRTLEQTVGTSKSENFEARVKVSFLGSEISAGPSLQFQRRHSINARFIAHGNEAILLNNGLFNHSEDRRIVFMCTASSRIQHTLSALASLRVFGSGASLDRGEWSELTSSQTSELMYVPFTQENGRFTNLQDILSYCQDEFFPQIKESLNIELKLAASQLVYSHEHMQCMSDSDCTDWHREMLGLIQLSTEARCIQDDSFREPVQRCQLRAKRNQACTVKGSNGQRLTRGYFEYPCDKNLNCTVTREGGWFTNFSIYSPWEAKCL